MAEVYSRLERAKSFLRDFIEIHKPICCFCKNPLDWKDFYPKISGKSRDNFTKHHKNGIHEDDRPKNRGFSHRDCHRRHHRLVQLFKEKYPDKKYVYKVFERKEEGIIEKTYKVDN